MSDNLNVTWDKFFEHRTKPLWDRFSGYYRALVVETNDPLRMHRVRFKCPDLHDWNLKDDDCPWAVTAFDFGVKRQGRWAHPNRGDWVWITFERNHPNAPIWIGIAAPTRRKFYSYPSVYGATPVPVNEEGRPQSAPDDYNKEYMPKDERPMSHGWQDRYGSMDLLSSVGFYPTEHGQAPAPPGYDAVQQGEYNASQKPPEANKPDVKHMTRLTKYGNMLIMGDQGYAWHKDGNNGEFKGDFDKDEAFEIKRWKYLQRLINEDEADSADGAPGQDQRRVELKTRYGSKIEIRDVGWAQLGPIKSRTRQDEYDDPRIISVENTNDFRWIKLRTKAGMLFQAYDKGSDPQEDKFVRRKLIDEVAHKTEREDEHWAKKDARWIRIITRYGYKIVLDDRGSDPKDAEEQELPRGNGILLKGRRTGAAGMRESKGDPRGFYWEFNENDELNHLTMGTPLGAVLEQNDRFEYQMLTTSLGHDYSTAWQKVKENEFLLEPAMRRFPERNAHHLKLDHGNEYIRFKTRANHGVKPDNIVNESNMSNGLNQGLEARDGSKGDGPWVELVDAEGRGIWCSYNNRLTTWRAKTPGYMFQFMDENQKIIALINGAPGDAQTAIKLICSGKIELIAADAVEINTQNDINFKSEQGNINLTAGGTQVTIDRQGMIRSNVEYMNWALNAEWAADAGAACSAPTGPGGRCEPYPPPAPDEAKPGTFPEIPRLAPEDRGQTYNGPFDAVPHKVVEHPIEDENTK